MYNNYTIKCMQKDNNAITHALQNIAKNHDHLTEISMKKRHKNLMRYNTYVIIVIKKCGDHYQ